MFNTLHLTAADIVKIQEGMNAEDLETMVAIVDRIVELKLKKAARTAKK